MGRRPILRRSVNLGAGCGIAGHPPRLFSMRAHHTGTVRRICRRGWPQAAVRAPCSSVRECSILAHHVGLCGRGDLRRALTAATAGLASALRTRPPAPLSRRRPWGNPDLLCAVYDVADLWGALFYVLERVYGVPSGIGKPCGPQPASRCPFWEERLLYVATLGEPV